MLNKERFHNSHLEVTNNSSSKERMDRKNKLYLGSLYRQAHQVTKLDTIPSIYFYIGGRIYRYNEISCYTLENFTVYNLNIISKVASQ